MALLVSNDEVNSPVPRLSYYWQDPEKPPYPRLRSMDPTIRTRRAGKTFNRHFQTLPGAN